MDHKKDLIIRSTEKLYQVSLELKEARARFTRLSAQGFSMDSEEMKQALEEFKALDELWIILEDQLKALWHTILQT
ncbi:MAG: hypothetical protein IKI69_03320 [Oscillospiraceae bacterium]|nr:hypothetical protein [Oscillospiraceae bacterium]